MSRKSMALKALITVLVPVGAMAIFASTSAFDGAKPNPFEPLFQGNDCGRAAALRWYKDRGLYPLAAAK